MVTMVNASRAAGRLKRPAWKPFPGRNIAWRTRKNRKRRHTCRKAVRRSDLFLQGCPLARFSHGELLLPLRGVKAHGCPLRSPEGRFQRVSRIQAWHVPQRNDSGRAQAQTVTGGGRNTSMIGKNLRRRVERLGEEIMPACTEEKVFVIISVDGDGNRVDSGIRIPVQQVPKAIKKGRW